MIVNFNGFGLVGETSGTSQGTITLTAEQVSTILSGNAYVNIHTEAFPGGEIRGQILLVRGTTRHSGSC